MANFRMIYDNAANRATLAVSSVASAALGAPNLTTDIKSQVWRTNATTTGVITATWAAAELIGGVMLPFTNLTASATIQVQAYTNAADATPVYDSSAVAACAAVPLGLMAWGSDILGVNAYSYGGLSYARHWFPAHIAVKKVVITVIDTVNPSGYIEIGRLVTGRFWEGERQADYGAALTPVDTTKNFRNDAGDLMSDIGPRHRKLTFSMSNLSQTERKTLFDILWGNGMAVPVCFSLYPNSDDPALEQANQVYCKLMTSAAMSMPSFLQYASSLELEEV